MVKLCAALFVLVASVHANAQSDNPKFNQSLADSLGADDFGMKNYVLAILKTGPATYNDKAKTDSLFRGHMQNIGRLASIGKLIVAGPLGKNDKNYRGIFILNVKTVEEAKLLVESDPAIKAKIFDVELYPWYGSAALPKYLPFHEKLEKKKF